MLATGASKIDEVKSAVKEYLKINKSLVLMQCNTNYTGDSNNIKFVNLNVLKQFKKMFPNTVLGLSDHFWTCISTWGCYSWCSCD